MIMSQNEESKTDDAKEDNNKTESILEDKWMIRDCEIYDDEYSECTSAKGRFHQYFIFGQTLNCNQWKKDYDNCCKWVSGKDLKAAEALINSEKIRRMERLIPHYKNDVWNKRKVPPSDWNKPLPEWMSKRDEHSYLAYKANEMKEGKEEETDKRFCSIM